jgi:tetratricopeptide (TPR) repeat protein
VIRPTLIVLLVLIFGVLRLPIENALTERDRVAYSHQVNLRLELREQIGQLGFIAALSGFRSLCADFAFIEAQTAWERTEWSRVLLCFQEATTLQPHSLLYWDMAAWHMAWNASAAALHERALSTEFLRRRAQRQYIDMGKNFLERGIRNNPRRPQLYESLARLYRDKYRDHAAAASCYTKAASLPGSADYDERFAAYELSYTPGRECEAWQILRSLYDRGPHERLPTLLERLKFLEKKLNLPLQDRIPDTQM